MQTVLTGWPMTGRHGRLVASFSLCTFALRIRIGCLVCEDHPHEYHFDLDGANKASMLDLCLFAGIQPKLLDLQASHQGKYGADPNLWRLAVRTVGSSMCPQNGRWAVLSWRFSLVGEAAADSFRPRGMSYSTLVLTSFNLIFSSADRSRFGLETAARRPMVLALCAPHRFILAVVPHLRSCAFFPAGQQHRDRQSC